MHISFAKGVDVKFDTGIFNQLIDILVSVNEDYTPTLFERIRVGGTLEEKLYYFLSERIEHGYDFYLVHDDDYNVIAFNNFVLEDRFVRGKLYEVLAIGTSAVHKKHQNRGIAKLLYQRIEDDAEHKYKVDAVTRTTWSTNTRQIYLYEKFGYKEYGREKDGRGVGVDGVHFYKIVNHDLIERLAKS